MKCPVVPTADVIEALSDCPEWYDVYDVPIIRDTVLNRYGSLRSVYEDLEVVRQRKTNLGAKVIDYLEKNGRPPEYPIEELKEKYFLIDYIACQICFGRPIKTRQIFLYGPPSTQKTLIFSFLARVLRIYFASSRRNDFTEADNYYDMWVFDEFQRRGRYITSAAETGTAYANTLLKVLFGQEYRVDFKYGRLFGKLSTERKISNLPNPLPEPILGEASRVCQARFEHTPSMIL